MIARYSTNKSWIDYIYLRQGVIMFSPMFVCLLATSG